MKKLFFCLFLSSAALHAALLLDQGRLNRRLLDFAEKGDKEGVQHALAVGAHINYREPLRGFTALMFAVLNDRQEVVELLLEKDKIDLDMQDNDGDTALMMAAENGSTDIIDLLLQAGASKFITNKDGETAADKARANENEDLASKLSVHVKAARI